LGGLDGGYFFREDFDELVGVVGGGEGDEEGFCEIFVGFGCFFRLGGWFGWSCGCGCVDLHGCWLLDVEIKGCMDR
jgi:hypothetical protein